MLDLTEEAASENRRSTRCAGRADSTDDDDERISDAQESSEGANAAAESVAHT